MKRLLILALVLCLTPTAWATFIPNPVTTTEIQVDRDIAEEILIQLKIMNLHLYEIGGQHITQEDLEEE